MEAGRGSEGEAEAGVKWFAMGVLEARYKWFALEVGRGVWEAVGVEGRGAWE